MTTPEKKSGDRLIKLAVELDEQLKSKAFSRNHSTLRLPRKRVSALSDDELNELTEASEVLAFLDQVRCDLHLLDADSKTSRAKSTSEPTAEDPELNETLGRFQIKQALGQGGFARVFRAYDPLLNRDVALKIPRPETLDSEDSRARFVREAKAAAMLSHPAIVTVFEAGTFGPIHYIASELCSGQTLGDWQDQQISPVSNFDAAAIVARLAEAIHHAHQRGIIHRDLKPSNIMVESDDQNADRTSLSDRLRIADFGLAKQFTAEQEVSLTIDGSVVGTPAYMSPEQVRCEPDVGPATDVYSLGVVLHELLTGAPPHVRSGLSATIRAVENEPVLPLRKIRHEISIELDAICRRCLEKQPADRYITAFDLAEDLDRYLNGQPVLAKPPGPLKRLAKWSKRNPVIATSIAVTFATLVAGIATSWSLYKKAEFDGLAAVEATEEKSDALDLAKTRMDEMTEQMDLLVSIFDEIGARDDGGSDNRTLKQGLRDNMLQATNRIFDSDSDPGLRSNMATRIGFSLNKLGFGVDAADITEKALALGKEKRLPADILLELEMYAGMVQAAKSGLGETIRHLQPRVNAILESERISGINKIGFLNTLAHAYHNTGQLQRTIETNDLTLELFRKYRANSNGSADGNESPAKISRTARQRLRLLKQYLASNRGIRVESAAKFTSAHCKFQLDRSEENMNALLNERNRMEETLGASDHGTIGCSYIVASELGQEKRFEEALEMAETALDTSIEKFGVSYVQTLNAINTLIRICGTNLDNPDCKKRLSEYLSRGDEYCRTFVQEIDEESLMVISVHRNVAIGYRLLGDLDKASEIARMLLLRAEEKLALDHPQTQLTRFRLAEILIDTGTPESEAEARQVLEKYLIASTRDSNKNASEIPKVKSILAELNE